MLESYEVWQVFRLQNLLDVLPRQLVSTRYRYGIGSRLHLNFTISQLLQVGLFSCLCGEALLLVHLLHIANPGHVEVLLVAVLLFTARFDFHCRYNILDTDGEVLGMKALGQVDESASVIADCKSLYVHLTHSCSLHLTVKRAFPALQVSGCEFYELVLHFELRARRCLPTSTRVIQECTEIVSIHTVSGLLFSCCVLVLHFSFQSSRRVGIFACSRFIQEVGQVRSNTTLTSAISTRLITAFLVPWCSVVEAQACARLLTNLPNLCTILPNDASH
mmetsp:Transcript_48619/g.109134  ORF Transcript_48619/g.109134 Transcript_48619/m.109134 type:complete len:276 (-) Transcript_48619:19-846(-)